MQLNASTRELLGKRTRRLHRQGKLAAVVYGHNTKPTALVLDRLEFQKVFLKSGRTHLLDLLVDSGRTEKVLVREIQTHPRRRGPIMSISTRSASRRRSRSRSRYTSRASPPRSNAGTRTYFSRYMPCAWSACRPTSPRLSKST